MFEISYHHFKEININRFDQFDFYEADKAGDFFLYTDKNMIVKFNEHFYIYNGLKNFTASEKQKSFILVTKGEKTIFKIND